MALLFNRKFMLTLGGSAVIVCSLGAAPQPASAAPVFLPGFEPDASMAQPNNDYRRWSPPIYKKGRTPIYPYYYKPPGPRGWEAYIGFVPYKKGDYGTQALQRSQYPDTMAWPPGMDVWPDEPQPPRVKKRRRY